jgi:DNA-binding LacI/PurR family transcriptional regulator
MSQNESTPISLADVARAAKVSVSTVSLVLRNMGTISPKTRAHVHRVAEKLGYRPNIAASLLARHDHAHTLPTIPVALLGMGFKRKYTFAAIDFVNAFTKYATKLGFQVVEPDPADAPDLPTLLRILYSRGVRGLLINHSFDTSLITEKEASRFSFVFYGKSLTDHRFHHVGTEVFESTRLVWETTWARGYRRIGAALFRHRQDLQDDFARESAILGCEFRYKTDHVPMFFGGHWDEKGFIEWMKEVRPDAIIGFNGAVYLTLLQAGFKVPEDVALSALHVPDTQNEVAGLYQDYDELARIAAHQLEYMIARNETGVPARPRGLLADPVFKEGRTLPFRCAVPPAQSVVPL